MSDDLNAESLDDVVSESERISNPFDGPLPNPAALLEPAERSSSDLILPVVLGIAGLGLLYFAYKKKSAPPKQETKPVAAVDSVSFSKLYMTYTIDKGWIANVFEPYLMEQYEEGALATKSGSPATNWKGSGLLEWQLKMANTRKSVIAVFAETHTAVTHEGDLLLSTIMASHPKQAGVIKFSAWLDEQVKSFQEEY